MSIVNSDEFAKQICETLGIDIERLASLCVVLEPGRPVTVSTTHFLSEDEAKSLVKVFDLYKAQEA